MEVSKVLKIPVLLNSLTWDFIYIINVYFIIKEEERKKKKPHTPTLSMARTLMYRKKTEETRLQTGPDTCTWT